MLLRRAIVVMLLWQADGHFWQIQMREWFDDVKGPN
jgi:hypothetical protein